MSSKPQQRTDFTLWLCVFISGLSALIYQVAWQRLLVRLVGAALPALTIVVCIFMTGLAIGSLIASDRCKTITSPRKIYSYLELALGALGFLIPWATERTFALLLATISGATEVVLHQNVVEALLTPAGGWFVNALLIVAVSILLLAPTILMGATLPVAVLAAVQRFSSSPHNGARVTSLYFINVAGAAIGSLTAAFFLMPVFGVNNTVRVAAAINLAASLLLQFSHRIIQLSGEPVSSPFLDEVEPQEGTQGADQSRTPIRLLAAVVAVCSAVALSMEVAWTRLFSLVLGSSTYALGAVLAFCLIGIAAGALLARKLLEGGQNRLLKLSALVALSLLCTAGQLFYMAELPWYLNSLEHSLAGNPSPFATYILVRVLLIGAVALPQSTLLGAVLPLALGQAAEKRSTAAQVTGTLLCASTTGSIAGTIITGCLLIPQAIPGSTWLGPSGIQSTVIIDALVQMGVVAALLWHCCQGKSPSDSRPTSLIYACASLAVLATGLVCLHPRWQPSVMSSGLSFISPSSLPALTRQPFGVLFEENKSNGSHTLSYKEGQTSTVTVGIVPANNVIYLKNDGKVEAALPIDPRLATRASDQPTQVLLGLVPALICADKPNRLFWQATAPAPQPVHCSLIRRSTL
jgi:spermidine synthase